MAEIVVVDRIGFVRKQLCQVVEHIAVIFEFLTRSNQSRVTLFDSNRKVLVGAEVLLQFHGAECFRTFVVLIRLQKMQIFRSASRTNVVHLQRTVTPDLHNLGIQLIITCVNLTRTLASKSESLDSVETG